MNWISCHLSQRFHFYITDHLGSVRAILDSQGNIKSTHDFEPFGVELQPLSDEITSFKYKYTGQERDNSTNLDYMHFRYYASTMGRFLKPDNIVPNAANPQSWNLYSYVNGNPVNFNDPGGHACPASIGTSPALYMERSSANWINWGALTGFYSNLYGGNVAFGGGAGGGEGTTQTYTVQYGQWVSGTVTMDDPYYGTTTGTCWVYKTWQKTYEITLPEGIKGPTLSLGNYQFQLGRYISPSGVPSIALGRQMPIDPMSMYAAMGLYGGSSTWWERAMSAQGLGAFNTSLIVGLGFAVIGGGLTAGNPIVASIAGVIGFVGTEALFIWGARQGTQVFLEPLPPGLGQFRFQTPTLDEYMLRQYPPISSGPLP